MLRRATSLLQQCQVHFQICHLWGNIWFRHIGPEANVSTADVSKTKTRQQKCRKWRNTEVWFWVNSPFRSRLVSNPSTLLDSFLRFLTVTQLRCICQGSHVSAWPPFLCCYSPVTPPSSSSSSSSECCASGYPAAPGLLTRVRWSRYPQRGSRPHPPLRRRTQSKYLWMCVCDEIPDRVSTSVAGGNDSTGSLFAVTDIPQDSLSDGRWMLVWWLDLIFSCFVRP